MHNPRNIVLNQIVLLLVGFQSKINIVCSGDGVEQPVCVSLYKSLCTKQYSIYFNYRLDTALIWCSRFSTVFDHFHITERKISGLPKTRDY